ncbi:MAG: hypothetical protein EA413_00580 [Cyanobium sp. PLM2.Bin73]|jgi:hypothetical protein|nr:MAG: hypothetical protein EA413_00580 [Cyanobium sp. PLM2.Bin73]
MAVQQSPLQSHLQLDQGLNQQALGLTAESHQGDAAFDPVEAYFECITTCSLDDGECITVCTELLREQV